MLIKKYLMLRVCVQIENKISQKTRNSRTNYETRYLRMLTEERIPVYPNLNDLKTIFQND